MNKLTNNLIMYVNNILCETLDTKNVIAYFYKSKHNLEEKIKIVKILNENYNTPNYKLISYLLFGH